MFTSNNSFKKSVYINLVPYSNQIMYHLILAASLLDVVLSKLYQLQLQKVSDISFYSDEMGSNH